MIAGQYFGLAAPPSRSSPYQRLLAADYANVAEILNEMPLDLALDHLYIPVYINTYVRKTSRENISAQVCHLKSAEKNNSIDFWVYLISSQRESLTARRNKINKYKYNEMKNTIFELNINYVHKFVKKTRIYI